MNSESKIKHLNEEFSKVFSENIGSINNNSSQLINEQRLSAFKEFSEIGIPSLTDENYRFTDLEPVLSKKYQHQFFPKKIDFKIADIFKCDIPELDTHLIILVNGWFYSEEVKISEPETGLVFGSFLEASKQFPGLFEKHYSKYSTNQHDGMVSLNTSFVQDGIFIYVKKNTVLQKPIQIVNITMNTLDTIVYHRNLFIFEENSEAQLVICDHSLSAQQFLTNSVNEIYLGENARLHCTRMQNEHNGAAQISSTSILQEKSSTLTNNVISLHGGFIRNNLNVTLNGEHCECNLYGLYLSDKFQFVDNNTFIDHAKPNCSSNQKYKGILDDMARGAFNGKILVRKDSQQTQAYQANNNILLTNDAKINTKPQLEIYADDVKCSHGATVGQLDANALFYLKSRGISEKEARLMLLFAFADEILQKIKVIPLRERIEELIEKRLKGELSRCNNCAMQCN